MLRVSAAQPGRVPTPLIEIGRIVNRHGVRGELRLLLHNPDSAAFDQLPDVLLRFPDGSHQYRRVSSVRRHQRFLLVKFDGVCTADDAETLRGCTVSLATDNLPPLGPQEVYYQDLVGCVVRVEDGQELGSVCEVFPTGSNDVCVVREGEREHLIPLIEDVVVRLNVSRGEIIIRLLPGLLDP
jgi:16S rRNA processing protein RimM